MKTAFPGLKIETDDNLVALFIKTQGLQKSWDLIKSDVVDRILIYDTPDGKERWIIQEFTGVPGDEGLHLIIVERARANHPIIRAYLENIEKVRGALVTMPVILPPPDDVKGKN